MIRRILLLLGLLCVADCSYPTVVRTSLGVQMQLDRSCGQIVGPQVFALSVDGVIVGTATLGLGDTSASWPITEGRHTISAEVPTLNLILRWSPITVDVGRAGVVYRMRCA